MDDKYTYPNSGGVLINSLGMLDAASLDSAINKIASIVESDLSNEPLQKSGFTEL